MIKFTKISFQTETFLIVVSTPRIRNKYFIVISQGAETSCVCVCTKSVCVRNYSLGEYICLLLILYLSLICM